MWKVYQNISFRCNCFVYISDKFNVRLQMFDVCNIEKDIDIEQV